MNGIFINTRKSQCSIYSSGLLINESLQSNEWNLDYIEIDKLSLDDLHNGRIVANGFSELYDFYIFNYHPSAMRDMESVDAKKLSNLSGRKYAIVLEVNPNDAFPQNFRMTKIGFDDYLVIDPTFKSNDSSLHFFPRPIVNILPIKKVLEVPEVPVIGSFGYATQNKNFDFIVHRAGVEFERALVKINIPIASYCSDDMFFRIKESCENNVRPGIELQITRDYMSNSDLVRWCSSNDLNCFMYDRQMAGLAATADQSISSGAPIAVFNNYTFRHLYDYIRPFPEWSFKDSILKSQDGIAKMREAWSSEACVNRFKEIHFSGENK